MPAPLSRAFSRPAAVFFHGVEREISDPAIQNNHHSRDEFVKIARALKESFDVLPLAALADVMKRPSHNSRALFLMSDDGYANTLSVAADILDDLKLPWALFVSTDHVDTGEANPMLVARLFFAEAADGVYRIPHIEPSIVLAGTYQREAEELRVMSEVTRLDAACARETIAAMREVTGNPVRRWHSERFLKWDEVRALQRRGVEIGAHARWHWPMNASQSSATLRDQVVKSKTRIEKEIGRCRYFAYPFGQPCDVGRGAWAAVRDAGFENAFTTVAGTLDASVNPWLLPRYGLGLTERNVVSLIAMLRAGNPRLRRWQQQMAA